MASIFKHEPTGQTIRPGKAWRDENRTQQPGNWHIWDADYKALMGIVEIVLENPPDSRFYIWSQNADGTINKTAKSLDDVNEMDEDGNPVLDGDGKQHTIKGVKSSLKEVVNSQQGSLLTQTDWMYIRKVDKSVEIPVHIQSWRDAIRVQGDAMKAVIDGAMTTEEMVALFVKYITNEDRSQTKSGILYDWPELEE
jgi:hypothetical protein